MSQELNQCKNRIPALVGNQKIELAEANLNSISVTSYEKAYDQQ